MAGKDGQSNVVSLSEWRRVQRRLDRMTLPELAMATHQLIDLMITLKEDMEELKGQVELIKEKPPSCV